MWGPADRNQRRAAASSTTEACTVVVIGHLRGFWVRRERTRLPQVRQAIVVLYPLQCSGSLRSGALLLDCGEDLLRNPGVALGAEP